MSAKSGTGFPEWVEKYRGPGRTVKKTKNGYALYECTSKYVAGKNPKPVQTYLGVIKEDEGFIPKRTSTAMTKPMYVEYGLSHLIWTNLKSRIAQSLWHSYDDLIRFGILGFIFGTVDETFIRSSFLTCQDGDRLVKMLETVNPKRIQTAKAVVERELHRAIPDDSEYNYVTRLLMLCVVETGTFSDRRPLLPDFLREMLEHNNLRFD